MTKSIIIKLLSTEKTVNHEKLGKYTFLVKNSANKIAVKKAIKDIYGSKVKDVNIIPVHPKEVNRRSGKGLKGTKAKKAILSLFPGESLNKDLEIK